ncbi:MAG: hypothetical protein NTZ27_11520 [Ignavibacteriales bacterium]|nr:hypothetical protein [Ignavibacteriales bacterium]
MSSSKDLAFKDWQKKIKDELGKTEWITVYAQDNEIKDVDQLWKHFERYKSWVDELLK